MAQMLGVAVAAERTAAGGKLPGPMSEHIRGAPSQQKLAAQNRKLLLASWNGDAEGVREALAHGACITAKNKLGRTALMMAAEGKGLYGQRPFSEAGAVEARLGETAYVLLVAAKEASGGDSAKFTAYVRALDNVGWDARRIAEYCGHRSIMAHIDAALRQ